MNKATYVHKIRICVYVICAVFYFWMAAQIPYTHDDWDWGLPVGIQQLISANINSRYVGNFFVVVMTRSEVIKTFVMGLGYWLIPFLLTEFAMRETSVPSDMNRLMCFLLCNVLLLTMDRHIWQQTYGWVAGYANFVISAIFMIIVIQKILRVFDNMEIVQDSAKKILMWGCIGFVSQLFLENIALLLFVLSVCAFAYFYHKNGCVSFSYLGLAAGTSVGLFVLFGSGIYRELWNSGSAVDGYRQVFINSEMNIYTGLARCLEQCTVMPARIWGNNIEISSMIILLLSGCMFKVSEKTKYVFLALNAIVLAFFVFDYWYGLPVGFAVNLLVNVIYFLLVAAEAVFLFRDNPVITRKLLVLWTCAPAVIAPLIVTTETGARLFFTSNVLIIFVTAMLFVKVVNYIPQSVLGLLQAGILIVAVCVYIHCGEIYYDIGLWKSRRDTVISRAIAADADYISLPRFPHEEYLWIPDPASEQRMIFFKQFYGIAQNVTVEFGK